MLSPTERVLDVLARSPGEPMPIREIARRVEAWHGTGHYSSIHQAVQELLSEGYVETRKSGRSRLAGLARGEFLLPGKLAAVTSHRLQAFVAEHPELQPPLEALVEQLWDHPTPCSVSIVAPGPNARIARLELLALTWAGHRERGQGSGSHRSRLHRSRLQLASALQEQSLAHAVRIDPLILDVPGFTRRLNGPERDPARSMLRDLAPLLHAETLWRSVLHANPAPLELEKEEPPDPILGPQLDPATLAWNAGRYGYPELGSPTESDQRWTLEPVVLGSLSAGARGRAGAAVLLAKNQPDPWMLTFLARKRKLHQDLLGLARALQELAPAPWLKELEEALRIYGDPPAEIETAHLRSTLETYDALG